MDLFLHSCMGHKSWTENFVAYKLGCHVFHGQCFLLNDVILLLGKVVEDVLCYSAVKK